MHEKYRGYLISFVICSCHVHFLEQNTEKTIFVACAEMIFLCCVKSYYHCRNVYLNNELLYFLKVVMKNVEKICIFTMLHAVFLVM